MQNNNSFEKKKNDYHKQNGLSFTTVDTDSLKPTEANNICKRNVLNKYFLITHTISYIKNSYLIYKIGTKNQ